MRPVVGFAGGGDFVAVVGRCATGGGRFAPGVGEICYFILSVLGMWLRRGG